MNKQNRRMPAEWELQSMVQLTWPHKDTDWAPILPEITAVYNEMAREIRKREALIIVARKGSRYRRRSTFNVQRSPPTTRGPATTALFQ